VRNTPSFAKWAAADDNKDEGGAPTVLLGRPNERGLLDRLLERARTGHGGTVVIHGEPGIGKSTLLSYATESATAFQVLRAVGNEAENELPFAAAQQLCMPGMAVLEGLPAPQREALGVAFGHIAGAAPDRLLVGLAILGLLSKLASEDPVLCIVDDAQWLDRESARAFALVARRLGSEHMAFLFAARAVPSELKGLPTLPVDGLGAAEARALLRSALAAPFDEHVLERILAEARGNPLALLELPHGLTAVGLAGGFALPVSVPLAGRIEASFRRRMMTLPSPSRRLLLLAAAEPTGDPGLLWRAAQKLGVDESAADDVETDGLLEMSPRVIFRHPLVRSSVYQAASPAERREVHRALAAVTDSDVDPDRRSWHLAHAALHPDDDVATELEVSATRAQARGGLAAAAAFLARAAELTVDSKRRVARTLAAADAKRQAGALEAALELASSAERSPLDDYQRAELDVVRARVSFASERGRDAPRLLLAAAQHLEMYKPIESRQIYLDAITAALFAGNLADGGHARDVAKAVLAAPSPLGSPTASDLLLLGLALLVMEGPATGTPVAKQALEAFRGDGVGTEERLRWSWLAGRTAAFIWDYDTWDALTSRQVELARAAGAFSVLPLTLSTTAGVQLFAGRLSEAEALFEQAEAVADATDTRTARYAAVLVAAFRGYEPGSQEFINAAAKDFAARGEGMGVTLTRTATAALSNGLARYEEAYTAAEGALDDPYELWYWPWATVELIEAASRTGRSATAIPAFERLTENTTASATVWAAAVEDRCRALLSERALAETLYRSAIDRLSPTSLRLDLARTHLLLGEWLRRENRPVDARVELRAAHRLFKEFGSVSYAERTQVELAATGERARTRSADSGGRLTPQETRVAQLVSQGATNVEIAAQMFLSPSTVEYHLHKVFRKLGVKSRTQLARHIVESAQEEEDLRRTAADE
jgi:DNA-binding CsgD family transcriptional regulator